MTLSIPAQNGQVSPEKPSRKYTFLFWVIVILVFITRLPFLEAGYGNDADAWALADAARRMALGEGYIASRLPGYPVLELLSALLWRGGPVLLNGCTALFSAVAVACFMRSVRQLGSPDHALAGLALACTPVIFINSTNSMDYMWALAFVLASYHCALIDKPLAAGALLGLGIGCRLTSAVMLLPIAVLLLANRRRKAHFRSIVSFGLAACLIGMIAFFPVFRRYGWGFLAFYEPSDYPPWLTVISRAFLRVWGLVGLMAITGALVSILLRSRRATTRTAIPASVDAAPFVAAAIALVACTALFVRLPLEEGYLIPAVPFVILLLSRLLTRRVFRVVCFALCLSPFFCAFGRLAGAPKGFYSKNALHADVCGERFVLDIFRGPLLRNHLERQYGMRYVDRLLTRARRLPKRSLLVVGYWLPQLQVRLGSESVMGVHNVWASDGARRYLYLLDRARLAEYRDQGFDLFFLPEMQQFNLQVHGVDLRASGAKPLDLYFGTR